MLNRNSLVLFVMLGLGVFSLTCTWSAKSSNSQTSSDANIVPMENGDKLNFFDSLPADFELPTDKSGELLLREYGAVFVARNGAVPPKKIFFESEEEVQAFQNSVETQSGKLGGIVIQLQKPAMRAFDAAVKDAGKKGLSISPRGVDSGRRGYNQTIALWKSRVEPGLNFWVGKGRLKTAEATAIRRMSVRQQINEILRLELDGIYFAKSLDKSIIYSVAPPGTSQHIAMLALDVKEFDDPRVRSILSGHGWFQTVVSDLPHFTYIGVDETELPGLGLKKVRSGNRDFWIPDFSEIKPRKQDRPKTPTPKPRQ
ncbi:hypothetical protein BH20ACI2_BH20ACI2_29030 [soil metagenome]